MGIDKKHSAGSMRLAQFIPAVATALLLLGSAGCSTVASLHPSVPADLGAPVTQGEMEAAVERPGRVRLQKVVFAEWTGGRGTFIDREDPRSAAVPLGSEKAEIYAYVIDHPERGRFLVDAGVSAGLEARLSWPMRRALSQMPFTVHRTTADWLADQTPPRAVFLTHLHFDHVGGLIDLPQATPVYAGPGEQTDRNPGYALLGRPADAALRDRPALRIWRFAASEGLSVIDIFGDGSMWAIHAPGHTPGSVAYLVNAGDGPKLITGDAAHTRLGWTLEMPQPLEPQARLEAGRTLSLLKDLVRRHPRIEVLLGHQSLEEAAG
jgi:N-acyl homoserine lactone hydrolase